ncbi:MAG TPA: hypothetical protein VF807_03200 [Ktedonobacterales bacterium]
MMAPGLRKGRYGLACLLLALPLVLSACALPFFNTTIEGNIYGEALTPPASTPQTSTPVGTASPSPSATGTPPDGALAIPATVICNGVKTTASAKGAFTVQVANAKQYSCTASGSGYQDFSWQATTRVGSNQIRVRLVSVSQDTACNADVLSGSVTCPMLRLKRATLQGKVHDAQGRPMASQRVRCGRIAFPTDGPSQNLAGQTNFVTATTTTDSSGRYSLEVRPGVLRCYSLNGGALTTTTPAPGATVTLDLPGCGKPCGGMIYHDGPVMHTVNAYAIYWLPAGATFEPGGSNDRFQTLTKNYFADVNGSALYNMLSQYEDYSGPVTPQVKLVGSFVDTTAYPKAGTRANPLDQTDIQTEVSKVSHAQHWPEGETTLFVLFTGYGIQSCSGSDAHRDCSFGGTQHYCAYHASSASPFTGQELIYAYIPVVQDCTSNNYQAYYGSPHGDVIAESVIDFLAHEHFEAVTDPYATGWYGDDPATAEIGDLCDTQYGAVSGSGNVSLNGHRYLMQSEWSNTAHACRFS